MTSAYSMGPYGGHSYEGTYVGRAARKDAKIARALKGVASYDLLAEVAREDAIRKRIREKKEAIQSPRPHRSVLPRQREVTQ